jgi:hypothetical protein
VLAPYAGRASPPPRARGRSRWWAAGAAALGLAGSALAWQLSRAERPRAIAPAAAIAPRENPARENQPPSPIAPPAPTIAPRPTEKIAGAPEHGAPAMRHASRPSRRPAAPPPAPAAAPPRAPKQGIIDTL